jgi:hypothetical protein
MLRRLLAVVVAAIAVVTLFSPSAQATDVVIRRGLCGTGPAHWVLAVRTGLVPGQLYVKFAVRGADPGVRWQVFLSDNGHRLLPTERTTSAAGSFRVVRSIRDRVRRDHIQVTASTPDAERCTANVVF